MELYDNDFCCMEFNDKHFRCVEVNPGNCFKSDGRYQRKIKYNGIRTEEISAELQIFFGHFLENLDKKMRFFGALPPSKLVAPLEKF